MYQEPLKIRHVEILQAYQAALNEATIVSITDLTGRILYANDMFTRVSKYSLEELVGNTHNVVNSGYHDDLFFKEMWDTIRMGKHWRGEIRNKTKDGEFYWVDTVISPVIDKNGNVFQYLSVRNLITKQKVYEEELLRVQSEIQTRKKQLTDAQKVAKTGSWYIDVTNKKLEWSDETYDIFEIPVGTPMSYELFLEKVHPCDKEILARQWDVAVKTGTYEVEHRILTQCGEKWVRERAVFSKDEVDTYNAVLGTVQDVTEKKITENILKESESLYRNLFNHSPFAMGLVDKESLQFLEVNKTAEVLYGYTLAEFQQLTLFDIRVKQEHADLNNHLVTGNYCKDYSIKTHRRKDGSKIKIESTVTELMYKGKHTYLITITDVTEKLNIQYELNLAKITRQKEIIEAQEHSRNEIAMELHDNVNQLLAASKIYLGRIHSASDIDRDMLDAAVEFIDTAKEEIRHLSASLVTPVLNRNNIDESIGLIISKLELHGISTEKEINIEENLLPDGLKVNIYRILQEQSNNIIKYAEASHVRIALTNVKEMNGIRLEIADNGKGFEPSNQSTGIGLKNIFYRAESYNGKAYIETEINKGCILKVDFVLSADSKEA